MSMCKCPKCGEMYSTSYKTCPFCEEDEAWAEGRPIARKGSGRRMSSKKDPSILGPLLVVIIILLAGVLVYFLFGEKIADTLGLGQMEPPSVTEPQPPSTGELDDNTLIDPENPDIEVPTIGGENDITADPVTPSQSTGKTFEEVSKLPQTLTLSRSEFTRDVSESPWQLKVNDGGTGYSWISEDEGIASVDENGLVTPISKGTVRIFAYTDTGMGVCLVRVRGTAATGSTAPTAPTTPAPSGGTAATPDPKNAKLNHTDFSLPSGDPPVQMKVTGASGAVTWSVDKPEVVSISAAGLVTHVGKGTAIITASFDNTKLTCIVRVPN